MGFHSPTACGALPDQGSRILAGQAILAHCSHRDASLSLPTILYLDYSAAFSSFTVYPAATSRLVPKHLTGKYRLRQALSPTLSPLEPLQESGPRGRGVGVPAMGTGFLLGDKDVWEPDRDSGCRTL